MCGIIGLISEQEFTLKEAFMKLKKLEYRGYDSFGYYDTEILIKKTGHIDIPRKNKKSKIAILHTRWATHGGVTDYNAHPHQSCDKNITIVHNGIIENYQELKDDLIKRGHKFRSETDSEVVAHYFEEKLKTKSIKESCVDFINEIKGTFAVLLIKKDENRIYALKRDSPLVLGICNNKNILASDIYAFSDISDEAIFFENDEFAIVEKDNYMFFDQHGKKINKKIQKFLWEQEESEKKKFRHYMIKEIMEEPKVVKRLLFSFKTEQKSNFNKFIELIKKSKKILFIAAGTSYHASLLGVYYLHECGIEAQTLIASEFRHFATIDKETIVIAVTQSGETMDVIDGLKYAQKKRAKIISIVNVPYSTIQRMSEVSLNILAGQEVCVAATKSFVNQVTILLAIAKEFGFKINLDTLAPRIESMLKQENKIKKIAAEIYMKNDIYVLGRGLSYPVAREVALKIKEISYIHAEGMMGGELKHGTIALIEKGTPVIALISNKDYDMLSNAKEVEARGANVIKVANELNGDINVPTSNDGKFGVLAAIFGQLLTYHMALERNLPIDKPRNLAKSVTVK
ncbi:glutamine--fructose-6-phosphate transaminase (isomerizing) [Candidatus Woesearchaeota archaeon]|nr:glutamine--fructose-6-phosphate transaminase (isomerizing) [Candidatus Woesearchaeota archaeon]